MGFGLTVVSFFPREKTHFKKISPLVSQRQKKRFFFSRKFRRRDRPTKPSIFQLVLMSTIEWLLIWRSYRSSLARKHILKFNFPLVITMRQLFRPERAVFSLFLGCASTARPWGFVLGQVLHIPFSGWGDRHCGNIFPLSLTGKNRVV